MTGEEPPACLYSEVRSGADPEVPEERGKLPEYDRDINSAEYDGLAGIIGDRQHTLKQIFVENTLGKNLGHGVVNLFSTKSESIYV